MTTETKTTRILFDEADAKTLTHFAMTLGLETKSGMNTNQLRALIQKVIPDVKDVPAVPAPAAPAPEPVPEPAYAQVVQPLQAIGVGEDPAARPAAVSLPASTELQHPSRDPKVTLKIHKTDDRRRAKDVIIGVNGDIYQIKRGVEVEVPFRVYLALNDAIEKAAIDTDETNQFTGEPIKSWEDVHSYPFSVIRMPSDEEIQRWYAATGTGFKAAS